MKPQLRKIIPQLIVEITGKQRYFPEVKWSYLWVHNIFRIYEIIFGRKYGIKCESKTSLQTVERNGRQINIVVREYFSFEALCAGIEVYIRNRLSKFINFNFTFQLPYKIYIPVFQTIGGFKIPSSPYLFAIAYSATTTYGYSGAATTVTISHTISGSDNCLWAHGTGNQSPTATLSATYAGVSMTELARSLDSVGTGVPTYLWYQTAPTSGTNNLVGTSSSNGIVCSCVSYTGVKQSSPVNANNNTALNTTTASMSKSLTTVDDNSWVIMTFRTGGGNAITAGANTTVRTQPEVVAFGAGAIIDSGAAITPPASTTLAVTCTSQFFGGQIIASFSPVVPSMLITRIFRPLQAINRASTY